MRRATKNMEFAPRRRRGTKAQKRLSLTPFLPLPLLVFCAFCVFVVMASGAIAGEINEKAGTTGFPFLKLVSGARATAMGGAFVAMDGDVNGMASNPASLASVGARQGTATYTNYLVDTQFGMVGAAQPLSEGRAFGAMLSYMSYGELQKTNEDGLSEGTFGANDIVLQGALAQAVLQSLDIGIGVKVAVSSIDDYASDAYMLDLGLRFRTPVEGLSLGASLSNVGFVRSGFSEEFKDALPVAARVGFAHQVAHLPLLFVGEMVLPNDNDVYFCGGTEICIRDILFLRGGYNSLLKDLNEDDWAGVALGCGFRWTRYRLDYAYNFFAELGEAHRVSVVGTF
ncbi:MAG: PorV/PorQ family protein [Candidatus Latescibacteria bacterium]|nr:PorV/PorQ family protein [Candidatus Latescibacterota bacterium]